MVEPKLKCYECRKRKPEEDTTLIPAKIGGDYKRAARRGRVRVCRECVQKQVDFARGQQTERLNTPVNSGRMSWAYGARYFGISVSGLFLYSGGPVEP